MAMVEGTPLSVVAGAAAVAGVVAAVAAAGRRRPGQKASEPKAHPIELSGDRGVVADCPDSAEAGDVVTVETLAVPGADVSVSATGVSVMSEGDGKHRFEMPEWGVTVDVRVEANASGQAS